MKPKPLQCVCCCQGVSGPAFSWGAAGPCACGCAVGASRGDAEGDAVSGDGSAGYSPQQICLRSSAVPCLARALYTRTHHCVLWGAQESFCRPGERNCGRCSHLPLYPQASLVFDLFLGVRKAGSAAGLCVQGAG